MLFDEDDEPQIVPLDIQDFSNVVPHKKSTRKRETFEQRGDKLCSHMRECLAQKRLKSAKDELVKTRQIGKDIYY